MSPPRPTGKPALLEAMVRAILDYFNAALETAKHDAPSHRLVRAYFDFARRFPVRYRFLLEVSREDSPLGAEVRQALGAVTSLVRAAQQAGELKDGDAEQIAALIFGTAYGMPKLARHGLAALSARDGDSPDAASDLAPLLLAVLAQTPAR